MVEDRGVSVAVLGRCGALLEKKGLHQAADILEKYWMVSETDVSDQRGKGRNHLGVRGLEGF